MLVVLFALFAAACSGDGDVQALEPSESSANEATTTTTEAEITTTAATSTSTEASADVARPELDPANWQTESDEVFGRYWLAWEALNEAYAPPFADADVPQVAELVGAEWLVDFEENVEEFRQYGEVVMIPEGSVEEHVLWIPNPVPLDKIEGNEVVIQDCWIRDHVVESEEGDVLDTVFENRLMNVTMKVIDGEWRLFASVTASDESTGWDECDEYFAGL